MSASSRQSLKVAVVMGGLSHEREVSLSSGRSCSDALKSCGYSVVDIDAQEDVIEQLKAHQPDLVFNALHGRFGEDGRLQGILEWLKIPYTHSGVLASAVAMNKAMAKDLYQVHGLPIAKSVLVQKSEVQQRHVLPVPYVVKPYDDGSSVGVYLVKNSETFAQLSHDMPEMVMVEEFVQGRELTVSVLGDKSLSVTEIVTNDWYDYEAKYSDGGSQHICPAQIPHEIASLAQDYALRAHNALGCRGLSRTDFRWDDTKGTDGLILLETNTQPGMTTTSLSPEQAQVDGMTFEELVTWMVEDASCER